MIIPGFSDYDITTDGVITKISTGRVIKPTPTYYHNQHRLTSVVNIKKDTGGYRVQSVIRLLALTYLEMPKDTAMAFSKDGDNTNTVLSNVQWVTRSDLAKYLWGEKGVERKSRQKCVSADSINMLHETMLLYERPITMTELAMELQVPYSVIRYSMNVLRERGIVRKIEGGFEVIR